jgi:5-oxopent-3-ene-1,2,5-tricarboxylate decarboxylase / 2-hydroxyhepta-2,4-diene-1,7-dioate isomerase
MTISAETRKNLESVATATLTGRLQDRGIHQVFFTGIKPIKPGQRMIGTAKTLRYAPMREDLLPSLSRQVNAQRLAIESIEPGEVMCIEARGDLGAGTFGDIYAMRMFQRGATGIVTDGCVRDSGAVGKLEIPVYLRAAHAATLSLSHLSVDYDRPVTIGGVLVMPGDVIVGDDDGAMVIPIALVDEVAAEAAEQELRDEFSFGLVSRGDTIAQAFPMNAERKAEFEVWKAART